MQIIKNDLSQFFEGLGYYLTISEETKQSLDIALASSFSVFDYINPNENTLSTIIANLLNPKGSHGQGSTFLLCFLERLEHKLQKTSDQYFLPSELWMQADKALVINEAATSYLTANTRRIDIRIHLSDEFGIGIENKPWAGEQENQLADYADELNRRYAGKFVLLFLNRSEHKPNSIAKQLWHELEASGKATNFAYDKDLYDWILECRRRCEADKIRHFLLDFATYIEINLHSYKENKEEK